MSTTNNKASWPPMPPDPMEKREEAARWIANAVWNGFLAIDPRARNYVHNYLYIGAKDGMVTFKHRGNDGCLTIAETLLPGLKEW